MNINAPLTRLTIQYYSNQLTLEHSQSIDQTDNTIITPINTHKNTDQTDNTKILPPAHTGTLALH